MNVVRFYITLFWHYLSVPLSLLFFIFCLFLSVYSTTMHFISPVSHFSLLLSRLRWLIVVIFICLLSLWCRFADSDHCSCSALPTFQWTFHATTSLELTSTQVCQRPVLIHSGQVIPDNLPCMSLFLCNYPAVFHSLHYTCL